MLWRIPCNWIYQGPMQLVYGQMYIWTVFHWSLFPWILDPLCTCMMYPWYDRAPLYVWPWPIILDRPVRPPPTFPQTHSGSEVCYDRRPHGLKETLNFAIRSPWFIAWKIGTNSSVLQTNTIWWRIILNKLATQAGLEIHNINYNPYQSMPYIKLNPPYTLCRRLEEMIPLLHRTNV